MTNRTAANRYARALLDVTVKEKGDLRQVERELGDFVALLNGSVALKQALLNPIVPVQRKRAAVTELTSRAGTSPVLAKLLVLLAERDRLVLVPDLLAAYSERVLDHLKIVRAVVTTAAPLPGDRSEALERRLAAVTGGTIALETKVDPSIIGGVITRIGSTIYDGSVTTQLVKMKQKLVETA